MEGVEKSGVCGTDHGRVDVVVERDDARLVVYAVKQHVVGGSKVSHPVEAVVGNAPADALGLLHQQQPTDTGRRRCGQVWDAGMSV